MQIIQYLDNKLKEKQAADFKLRMYNDIAMLLWYKVAYDDVLSYKRTKMNDQSEPFRIYQWGDHNLIYGPIKALTSDEDKRKFVNTAQAELRDRGYKGLKVSVYPDCVIVSN